MFIKNIRDMQLPRASGVCGCLPPTPNNLSIYVLPKCRNMELMSGRQTLKTGGGMTEKKRGKKQPKTAHHLQ
ncbi:MAG: hypothetical protein D6714_06000 [Bacteroidetes bacterium]|nr:MAG: hypothetical protein D6714_06000 [Bacteroidota bacterium]